MRYWLMKSEPSVFGIDDLAGAPGQTTAWWGVRNYQARNFMRDEMRLGDQAFFYYSSCEKPGITGVMKVVKLAYPDQTQFDHRSEYHDSKATPENPRWFNVNVKPVKKTRLVPIEELRRYQELSGIRSSGGQPAFHHAGRAQGMDVHPGDSRPRRTDHGWWPAWPPRRLCRFLPLLGIGGA